MLPQILVMVFFSALVVFALLANELNASATHQALLLNNQLRLALDDSTNILMARVQRRIATRGSSGNWPRMTIDPTADMSCSKRVDGETVCPYTYHAIASFSGTTLTGNYDAQANALALNLQTTIVGEQRLSVSLIASVESDTGNLVATRSRRLIVRIFNVPPYAIVSGERDTTSINGTTRSSASDDGGILKRNLDGNFDSTEPNPSQPDSYRETAVNIRLVCSPVNAIGNSDSLDPSGKPNNNQGAGTRHLPWGIGGGVGYELPCTGRYVATPPIQGYVNKNWANGDQEDLPSRNY